MGDRANIIIKETDEQVCLYTHWRGSDLHHILHSALVRGKDRWDDFQYLTRIIFCEMIKNDILGNTGYGITQKVHDGENHVLVIDVVAQTVQVGNGKKQSISAFCQKPSLVWKETGEG